MEVIRPAKPVLDATTRVLVVDDDELVRQSCQLALSGAGYLVAEATDGTQALAQVEAGTDLIILDIDMPKLNGWDTLIRLREQGNRAPVLMLTGNSGVPNLVRSLAQGADDFLSKPCDHRELLARVHALLRRSRRDEPVRLHFDGTVVNLESRTAARGGKPLALTRTEYQLLEEFARQPGRILTREGLLKQVWGYAGRVQTRTLDTHIWRLRAKLGDDGDEPRFIQTAPGGYRLAAGNIESAGIRA